MALSGDAAITNAGVVTVNGVKGKTVSAAPTVAGQLLRYDGTDWTPAALVAGDIPSLDTGKLTSGTLPLARGGTGLSAGGTGHQFLTMNAGATGLEYKSLAAGTGVSFTNSGGVFTISATGSGGTVTNVTGSSPISVTSGTTTPAISISQANASTNGFLSSADWTTFNNKAPTASPAFSGTPTAPTAAANTNTTQIATTAFVLGQASSSSPLMDGVAAVGTGTTFARADHVHPTDTSRAPAAGSTSITTLGTITTGTWNASVVGVAYGGTGTNNGSITGTGALTFTAGGSNQNLTLTPSGTGFTILNGNVGVGTTGPAAKFEVVGQARSIGTAGGGARVNASASVNWNNGNTQSMSVDCATTTFSNMLDGGSYTLAVTHTGTSTCSFSQSGLVFYFSPANGPRVSGQRTLYSFQRIGNDVYVTWTVGFQ